MRRLWVVLAAGALVAAPATAADVAVEAVRAWSEDAHTRIVFDLTGPAEHHVFTLPNPPRVVIDLERTEMRPDSGAFPEAVGVVQRVRAAERGAGDLRVVLDLAAGVQARSFFAGPSAEAGERLVVDLGERTRRDTVRRAPSARREIVIAIDPGHGGRDPGAVGRDGTREKDVVLAIARKLAARVDAQPGMRALLVRNSDVLIDHRVRFEAGRNANADLFVSIHADAVEDRRARGSSVYALSLKGASDEASQRLADSQNASLIGGVELRDKEPVLASVLMDLSQTATLNASLAVGQQVLDEMGRVNRLHRRTVQQAGFIVLKSPDVPSILVETAYISNPEEERNLRSTAHQQKLADAIFAGIHRYFVDNPPVDSLIAQLDSADRETRTYTITSGDTLSEIADRYRVSVSRLRRENSLTSDRIRVGQVLRIPGG